MTEVAAATSGGFAYRQPCHATEGVTLNIHGVPTETERDARRIAD